LRLRPLAPLDLLYLPVPKPDDAVARLDHLQVVGRGDEGHPPGPVQAVERVRADSQSYKKLPKERAQLNIIEAHLNDINKYKLKK